MARRHSLTAAASISIEQVTSLPLDFKEEKYKVVRRLSLFDIERKKVLDTFEKSGIRYVPLKGIVLKDYYPKAIMREMSDSTSVRGHPIGGFLYLSNTDIIQHHDYGNFEYEG